MDALTMAVLWAHLASQDARRERMPARKNGGQ